MQYYAIQHKKTERYISGTDFSRKSPRQILTTPLCPPMLFNGAELSAEIGRRHINLKDYRVIVVEVRKAAV